MKRNEKKKKKEKEKRKRKKKKKKEKRGGTMKRKIKTKKFDNIIINVIHVDTVGTRLR